ncbi:MAG: hypothetical protein IKO41_11575 [Lachnospiraceae bacterium]|nr:hypothetical protein [Lachnospiraceae bacterium]
MANEKNPFEGFEVISVYTREQAIADGVLHDVTDTAKECGFRIPVAVTDTIWGRWIEASPELQEYGQSTEARLRDVLTVLWFKIRALSKGATPRRLAFRVRFLMDAENEGYEEPELTCDIGPGDAGEPVLTILIPEIDD